MVRGWSENFKKSCTEKDDEIDKEKVMYSITHHMQSGDAGTDEAAGKLR